MKLINRRNFNSKLAWVKVRHESEKANLLGKVLVLFWLFQIASCSSNNTSQDNIETRQVWTEMNFEDKELASIKKETVTEERFWLLIEDAMEKSGNHSDKASEFLKQELQKLSLGKIIGFEFKLREKLLAADHFNAMIPLKIMIGSVEDDSYLYYRCWLIFQGKRVFENTIKDPDYLAGYVPKEILPWAEFLLYVTDEAFSAVTGITEENEFFPRGRADAAGLYYDGHFDPPKGQDWTENDLPIRAPKLWEMFNTN